MRIVERVDGIDAALGELASALDATLAEALAQALQAVAQEARASHPYQNRTGDLEASTQALGRPGGTFLEGSLEGDVNASEEYASYLDNRAEYAFLEPAWERQQSTAEALMDQALTDAITRAGWG